MLDSSNFTFLVGILPSSTLKTFWDGKKLPVYGDGMCLGGIWVRDGHADADDAEVCGLMRICAYADAIRKTKSVCA